MTQDPRRDLRRRAPPSPMKWLLALVVCALGAGAPHARGDATTPPIKAAKRGGGAAKAGGGAGKAGGGADKAGGGAATEAKLPTIAVLYFDTHTGPESELWVLRKGLAQMLVSDLSALEGAHIVERDRLEAILAEQKLQRSSKFDAKTAARVGKLLGARLLVLGSVIKLGAAIRMDARVVEVETGKIVFSVGVTGGGDDFFGLEGNLAARLLDELGKRRFALASAPAASTRGSGDGAGAAAVGDDASRRPKRAKRRRLRRPKKLSIDTASRYARALDAKDRGDAAAAKAGLEAVVKEAPDFELAYVDLQSMTR